MEFRILGPLEVRDESGEVELRGVKPRAVLAVLLLHANEPVSAERLAVALWGEDAPADAVRTVQVHVSRLRKALGDSGMVTTTPAGYRLRVGAGELDAERFARGVAEGRRALEAGDAERAGMLLREALELWRGPALADLEFEPFAAVEIARLQEQRLVAVEARVEADLARGSHRALVSELQQLRAEHPMRERLTAQLMLALYRSGRQAEALEVYRHARRVLVEEFGIEPGTELREVHQAILVHDAALEADPGMGSARVRRGALPSPPNRTIGREREVRAVVGRLRGRGVRLLTLTGPGGVGKTRLALEAARAVEADFADGAWFVSLAAVQRRRDVAAAIVSSLAIVTLAGESTEEAIERFLAAKRLLLVVDNCEHLPTAAPLIGRLPAAGPGVTVLATSREPLAVHAEHVQLVPPLGLPEPGAQIDRAALAGVGSAALFCERAQAHDAGFELCEENASAVVAICRRLDGLPLAIELAAARCGLLSPREIAGRLDRALDALGAGARDAPARQKTLRATLDWSHSLLDDDEETCFARFAVFAGGATVEAAEAITCTGIQTLDRLVAKNLLVRRAQAGAPTRLVMLETVRAYAAERFAERPDQDEGRRRHYRYFLALAVHHGADQALFGRNRIEHFNRLDSEVDNFRAAFEWALQQRSAGPVSELAVALVEYWFHSGRPTDAVQWSEMAVTRPGAGAGTALRARLLARMCWPMWAIGRGADVPPRWAEAETIARTRNDPALLAEVVCLRAGLEAWQRRLEVASPLADEALALARAIDDPWKIAMAIRARALASDTAAELLERVEEAVAALEQAGNVYHQALLLHSAGEWALRCGRDHDARRHLDRAIPLTRALDQPYAWMLLLGKLGGAALLTGDTEAARDAFREQLALCRELGVPPVASECLLGLAAVAAVDEDLDRVARLAGAAASHRFGEPERPVDERLSARFLSPARARHGPDAWYAAARAGGALSLEEAFADAQRAATRRARSHHGSGSG